jgi:hypothetical protein
MLINGHHNNLELKDVVWSYNKDLAINNNEVSLSGFNRSGSIITESLVDYNNTLDLSFDFQMIDTPKHMAAVFDIDFGSEIDSFFSFTFSDIHLVVVAKEGDFKKIVGFIDYPPKSEWFKVKVSINRNKASVKIKDHKTFEYVYQDRLPACRVSFGNNFVPDGYDLDQKPSFKIANVLLSTRHGDFPLYSDNLKRLLA